MSFSIDSLNLQRNAGASALLYAAAYLAPAEKVKSYTGELGLGPQGYMSLWWGALALGSAIATDQFLYGNYNLTTSAIRAASMTLGGYGGSKVFGINPLGGGSVLALELVGASTVGNIVSEMYLE